MAHRLPIASLVFLFTVLGCSKGEWKPVGDGRTIVNTRTGELVDAKTGLKVEELNKQRDEKYAIREEEHRLDIIEARKESAAYRKEKAEKDRQAGIETAKWKVVEENLRIRRERLDREASQRITEDLEFKKQKRLAEEKIHKDLIAADKARKAQLKAAAVANIKANILEVERMGFSPLPYSSTSWRRYTLPYRLDREPDQNNRDYFLEMMLDIKKSEASRLKLIEKGAKKAGLTLEDYMAREEIPPIMKFGSEWDRLFQSLKSFDQN